MCEPYSMNIDSSQQGAYFPGGVNSTLWSLNDLKQSNSEVENMQFWLHLAVLVVVGKQG